MVVERVSTMKMPRRTFQLEGLGEAMGHMGRASIPLEKQHYLQENEGEGPKTTGTAKFDSTALEHRLRNWKIRLEAVRDSWKISSKLEN